MFALDELIEVTEHRVKDECADKMKEYERKMKAEFDTKEKRMTGENMRLNIYISTKRENDIKSYINPLIHRYAEML